MSPPLFHVRRRRSPTALLFSLACVLAALLVAVAPPALATAPQHDPFTDLRTVNERRAAPPKEPPPACVDGICPLLGRGLYLPNYAINTAFLDGTGKSIFNDVRIGSCARLRPVFIGQRQFVTHSDTESVVRSLVTETSVEGGASALGLSFSTTLAETTGYLRGSKVEHNSAVLDITIAHLAVDLLQDGHCVAARNLNADLLADFKLLPEIKEPTEPAEWVPYTQFLRSWGSHALISQFYGSRFRQWESATKSRNLSADVLKAKACLAVEGASPSGWSVRSCSGIDESTIRKARSATTTSKRNVLGGSEEARLALLARLDANTLDAFIASSTEAKEAVMHHWKPLWDLLYGVSLICEGKDCDPTPMLQRALNLEAAYQGWEAVGCRTMRSSDVHLSAAQRVFQEMRVASTSSSGLKTFGCWARKNGCMQDKDCWPGGSGFVCYCYGPSCIAEDLSQPIGDPAKPSDYRDRVQGNHDNLSYDQGVNRSCNADGLFTCGCNGSWSGGRGDRYLWLQNSR